MNGLSLSVGSASDGELPVLHESAAPARRCRRRIRQPVKDSLYDLMHEHSGTSLFVRPICWTDIHAQILGAHFHQLPPCDQPTPATLPGSPPSRGHLRPSQTVTTLSNALTEILSPQPVHPIICASAVRNVLQTLWPETFSKPKLMPEWHLHFGGRTYRDTVRAPIVWNFPSISTRSSCSSFQTVSTRPAASHDGPGVPSSPTHNKTGLPMLCYIGRAQLASIRKNLFRIAPGPKKTPNEPVSRLQQLRAKALIPSNADNDAHFVGIFLAMAQKHFYENLPLFGQLKGQSSRTGARSNKPRFEDIVLRILTHDTETSDFMVYTAYVTAGFLERFEEPSRVPRLREDGGVPGMRIEHTRIPIWPILGLKERLGLALGYDLVGAIDVDKIERWEEPEGEDARPASSSKRKRQALTEVVNSSFEEDADDEPALGGKKRCLAEGPPIGMVM